MKLSVLGVLFFSQILWADLTLVPAHSLEVYTQRMNDILKEKSVTQNFSSYDGLPLSFTKFSTSGQNHPLIVDPGRGETFFRWVETIDILMRLGYGPIYYLDHRGQGFSPRLAHKYKDVQYIPDFSIYVKDLTYFIENVVKKDLIKLNMENRELDLVSHSMGAAIANLALIEKPDLVSRVVQITPMLDINTHSPLLNARQDAGARLLVKFLCAIGCNEMPIGLKQDIEEVPDTNIRRKYAMNMEKENHIHMLGSSPLWINTSIAATLSLRKNAAKYRVPTLLIMASQDNVVGNDAIVEYSCKAQNCSLIELEGEHSLQLQTDDGLLLLAKSIHEFLKPETRDVGSSLLEEDCVPSLLTLKH